MQKWLLLLGAVVIAALAALTTGRPRLPEPTNVTSASGSAALAAPFGPSALAASSRALGRDDFVGSAACAPCHQAQSSAYERSHHAKALTTPSPEFIKPRFDGAHFDSKLGGRTQFNVRDGHPLVTTLTAGGKLTTYPIAYVSGVWPLEQYVVATERGKLQSLGVVWDSRAAAEGGAKWFHVYGAAGVAPGDPLFFSAPAQSWNHICADCHSTALERRYDVATDAFDTRWAELSVGCEACHGPGAEHVRTAQAGRAAPFAAKLSRSETWLPSATGSPTPREQTGTEVEVCAPCHSRRTPLKAGFLASEPFLDSFEPDLLRPGRYHADGQVDGEVYEWGSFLQSRMYRAGVKCSDCHEPHSAQLFAPGNALCVRCHDAKHFDVEAHSHHAGRAAPRCIDCHMPPKTFMQVDERRDHSIRIPRPDLSAELGTPNACNACHDRQTASWASAALHRWYPQLEQRPHFGRALAKERQGTLDAPSALRGVADDPSVPAIARASALERLGAYESEKTLASLRAALGSSESLVVYGAVRGAAQLSPQLRGPLLTPLLEHGTRAVRVAAAKALAGVPAGQLSPNSRQAFERAVEEVEQSFGVSASRPETHVERSAFELARGNLAEAEAALRIALRLAPCQVEAQLNLADLARQRHDEAAAERALRAAIACEPNNAAAHHALGLWQVRAHQTSAAIVSFRKAVELSPGDPRFSYVLAVALASSGTRKEAIQVLETTLKVRPNDANARRALVGYLRETGDGERAAAEERTLQTLQRE